MKFSKILSVTLLLLIFCVEATDAKGINPASVDSVATSPKLNIIRFSPITVLDVGIGFGLGYERLLGTQKKIGIVVPVNLIFDNNGYSDANYDANNKSYTTYFYTTPSIKFYLYKYGKITYALGPSLVLGLTQNKSTQNNFNATGILYTEGVTYSRVRFGFLANNYVSIAIGKSFNIGLEGGLGLCCIDKVIYSGSQSYAGNGTTKNRPDIEGQFSLSVGYKF